MPYHTIPHHTMPYHTMPPHPRDIIPCNTMSYHTMPYHSMPWHAIPYRAILHNTTLRHTITCHTIPHHAIPCHVMLFRHALRVAFGSSAALAGLEAGDLVVAVDGTLLAGRQLMELLLPEADAFMFRWGVAVGCTVCMPS